MRNFRLRDMEIGDRINAILSLVSLILHDVTEDDVIDYLTLGGVDLSDPEALDIAKGNVSWLHGFEALRVSDQKENSLVDLEHETYLRGAWDQRMLDHVDKLKVDGQFFREFMVPQVED